MIRISQPVIENDDIDGIIKVLKSGQLVQSKVVKDFEYRFSSYVGTKYAVAVSNGTTALHAALLACDLKPGDEIITTPFSFISSANMILQSGAKPVFADIDYKTFNLDPEKVKEKISSKTRGILLVHLYGQPCEMDFFTDICDDKNLILIEDACQAHGAEYKGKKVGSFGNLACFSFYATKNITTGEGGMITTNSEELANKCRMIRNQGQEKKYYHSVLGFNYRMTEFQAALGISQLKRLDVWNEKRINNSKILTEKIKQIKGLVPPFVLPNVKHVFHRHTIRVTENFCKSREDLIKDFSKKNIEVTINYPLPIHKQPFYKSLRYDDQLPEAEHAAQEVLSLPNHQLVNGKDINLIIETLKK
jgi:perosamine synthetase